MQLPFKQLYARYHGYFVSALATYSQKPNLKKYLELFLSLGTVSLFSIFAIKPTSITIISLVKEIQAKEQTIKTMDTKIENLKIAQNVYYQQKENLDLLDLALPSNPAPETFARQLEVVSYLNSISINNLSFSETVLKGQDNLIRSKEEKEGLPAKILPTIISFNGKGEYGPINDFITNLENLRRFFKVDTVNISLKKSTKDDSDPNMLLLSLSGRLLYFSQEAK